MDYSDEIFIRGSIVYGTNLMMVAKMERNIVSVYNDVLKTLNPKNNISTSSEKLPIWFFLTQRDNDIVWESSLSAPIITNLTLTKSSISNGIFNINYGSKYLYFDNTELVISTGTSNYGFNLSTKYNVDNDFIYSGIPYSVKAQDGSGKLFWNFLEINDNGNTDVNTSSGLNSQHGIIGGKVSNPKLFKVIKDVKDFNIKIYFIPTEDNLYFKNSLDKSMKWSNFISALPNVFVPVDLNSETPDYFRSQNFKYYLSIIVENLINKIDLDDTIYAASQTFLLYSTTRDLFISYIQNTNLIFTEIPPGGKDKIKANELSFIFYTNLQYADIDAYYDYCLPPDTCGVCFGMVKSGDASPCKLNYNPDINKTDGTPKPSLDQTKVLNKKKEMRNIVIYCVSIGVGLLLIVIVIYFIKKK